MSDCSGFLRKHASRARWLVVQLARAAGFCACLSPDRNDAAVCG